MDGIGASAPPLVPADPSVQTGSFTAEDPGILEQATRPWDNTVTSLSRGPFRQDVTFLSTSGLILYRELTWNRTRTQGLSPPGIFAFTVPLRIGSQTRYWGAPRHETGLPVMMPGGVHVEFSAGQQHLIAMIDYGLLVDSLPEDSRKAIERAARTHVISASRDAVAQLGARLNTLLDGAQTESSAFQHPHAVGSMQQDLITAFRQSLTLPVPVPKRVGRAIRQRGLQRAVEYLWFTDTSSMTVPELCRAARVTERTL